MLLFHIRAMMLFLPKEAKRKDIVPVFPPHLVRSCNRANEHKRGKEEPGPPEHD